MVKNRLLEFSIGGSSFQHGVDVGESIEGRNPRNIFHFLAQVPGYTQGCLVVQVPGLGQVDGVVDYLGPGTWEWEGISPVDHVYAQVVSIQLFGDHLPVFLVIVDPVVAGLLDVEHDCRLTVRQP